MNDFKLQQCRNTQTQANDHACHKNINAESEFTSTSQSFGGRILTWLGKWPAFHKIGAVREHANSVKIQNNEALKAFVGSLAGRYTDTTVAKVIDSMDITSSNKPLTQRKIEAVMIPIITDLNKKEVLSEYLINKYGADIAKSVLSIHGIISGNARVDNIKDSIRIESKMKEFDQDAVIRTAHVVYNTTLDSIKNVFPKVEKLKELTGNSLKSNFEQLSAGDGSLRSMLTAMKALSNINGITGLHDFLFSLENIKIGGIKFTQWATVGQSAESWVKKASEDELNSASEKIKSIASAFLLIKECVENCQRGIPATIKTPDFNIPRFRDISVDMNTQVRLSDGIPMPVNKVTRCGSDIALAGTYPKNTILALESHVKMLLEQRCSSLIVLASEGEIINKQLPGYFRGNKKFGAVRVESNKIKTNEFASQLIVDKYHMKISYNEKSHAIPVMHVKNWGDHQPLNNPEQLYELAMFILSEDNDSRLRIHGLDNDEVIYENVYSDNIYQNNSVINSYENGCDISPLPMIHCLGGVGRTGTLITAMEMIKNPSAGIDDIISELRDTRNFRMVEDNAQRAQLEWLSNRIK